TAASIPTTASCWVFTALSSGPPARPAAEQAHKVLQGGPVSHVTPGPFGEVPLVLEKLTIQLSGLGILVGQRLQPRNDGEIELVEPPVRRGAEWHAAVLFLGERGPQLLDLVDHLSGLRLLGIQSGEILEQIPMETAFVDKCAQHQPHPSLHGGELDFVHREPQRVEGPDAIADAEPFLGRDRLRTRHFVPEGLVAPPDLYAHIIHGEVGRQRGHRRQVHDRIRALNTLGFSVDEVELTAVQGGERLRLRAFVADRSFHRDLLQNLTGLDAEETQAQQMINEIQELRATLSQKENRSMPLSAAAYRWLNEFYLPIISRLQP